MFRSLVITAVGLVAACASAETTSRYNQALEKCLASEDVSVSNECKKAELLRDQMEIEREQNTSVAVGAATIGLFTLGTIAVLNDCCYGGHYYRPYRHGYYGRGYYGGHKYGHYRAGGRGAYKRHGGYRGGHGYGRK